VDRHVVGFEQREPPFDGARVEPLELRDRRPEPGAHPRVFEAVDGEAPGAHAVELEQVELGRREQSGVSGEHCAEERRAGPRRVEHKHCAGVSGDVGRQLGRERPRKAAARIRVRERCRCSPFDGQSFVREVRGEGAQRRPRGELPRIDEDLQLPLHDVPQRLRDAQARIGAERQLGERSVGRNVQG
jgi:hypothetical protein